jgi:hypothetical protein
MAGSEDVLSANPPARRLVAVPDPFDDDRAGDLS